MARSRPVNQVAVSPQVLGFPAYLQLTLHGKISITSCKKTLQLPPQQPPHFLNNHIWLSEGKWEVALDCTQVWSVFSTICAWRSGNRWWKDRTNFIMGSHTPVPASAVASGHHLQKLGSLTLEEEPAMEWGLLRQLLMVDLYATGGKTFIFIWTSYYVVLGKCSNGFTMVTRVRTELLRGTTFCHWHNFSWCDTSPF